MVRTASGFLVLTKLALQDFHLAKRHYDLALETNSEAYLPVILSLAKLYIRSAWHTMMGGQGGLSLWGPDDDELGKSLLIYQDVQFIYTLLVKQNQGQQIDDGKQTTGADEASQDEDAGYREEEDGPWYFGKAKEEFRRRSAQSVNTRHRGGEDDEDPIQVLQLFSYLGLMLI